MGFKGIRIYLFRINIFPTYSPTVGMLQAGNKDVCVRTKSTLDDQPGKHRGTKHQLKTFANDLSQAFSFHASTIHDCIILMSAHLQRQTKLLRCYRRHTDQKKLTNR